MKKIIILLALLCTGSICNAQYQFSTIDIVRTKNPVLVFVMGKTIVASDKCGENELHIVSGKFKLIINFQNDSRIFSNWKADSLQRSKDWKDIVALTDSLNKDWEYLLSIKNHDTTYINLVKKYILRCQREVSMRDTWDAHMSELPTGNLGIYDAETAIPIQSYALSLLNFEYSIPPDAIVIMGYVENSNLQLALLLDISKLPDIFAKIFPISKKK